MGLTWSSTRHDHYLHNFQNPRVQSFSKEFVLDMNDCNNTNPFQKIIHPDSIDQKAVVCSVTLKTLINGYDQDIAFFISNLYPNQHQPIQIVCPSNTSENVDTLNRLIFKHEVAYDKIQLYAGLDDVVLRSNQDSDYECLQLNHPLVEFILKHGSKFNPQDGDVIKKKGDTGTYYLIRDTFLKNIREFLKTHVYDKMNYSQFKDSKVFCVFPHDKEADKKTLLLILNVNYVLVNPGIGELIHTEEKIN